MKQLLKFFMTVAMVFAPVVFAEPLSTAFTYQGQLNMGGTNLTGTCDFRFELYDTEIEGVQIGSSALLSSVGITDGYFTVELDFGADAFKNETRWLEIAVTCPPGAASPTILEPRQKLTASPYALSTLTGGDAAKLCDLENRIYAALPEFERSTECRGVLEAPVLISADGPYSDTTAVDVLWANFETVASGSLNEEECILFSGLHCEAFYRGLFADTGVGALLRYQISAQAEPDASLFFYVSGNCSNPTMYEAIRQFLEYYVSTYGAGQYLALVLNSPGVNDFEELLDQWETLGVLSPLVGIPATGQDGRTLGDVYVPDGTVVISAVAKLVDQVSPCSNQLNLPLP